MKKNAAFILFISFVSSFYCQTPQNNYAPDLNIKTPEVGGLLKYVETPVSFNTGLPNISVPIYQIKEGDIEYPINVNYNSSGVNVNERAGWLGMGFSISQPQITRNIKGMADDFGFLKETLWLVSSSYVKTYWATAHHLATNGVIDLESDEYRAILPSGESITFYFNQVRNAAFPYGEVIQVPVTNNKITPIFSAGRIIGWEIISSNGTIYSFSTGNEVLSTAAYQVSNESLPTTTSGGTGGNYYTSWMLSKIKSTSNNELNFNYTSHFYTDCNLGSQQRTIDSDTNPNMAISDQVSTNYQETTGYNYFLSSIAGDFGTVSFALDSNPREDYNYGKKLNSITIKDKNQNLINEYSFDYLFTLSDVPFSPIYSCGGLHNPNDLIKRMFLNKITILGNNPASSSTKPFYKFNYNPLALPHRFSRAIDWWGFYNGKDSNKTLVPTIRRNDVDMPNRDVNPTTSQAGLLNEVVFPTGASTKFEFESNRGINTKPIITAIDNTVNGGVQTHIDGINIIPSKKEIVHFNSTSSNPISIQGFGDEQKRIYELPFTIGNNVIGYYNKTAVLYPDEYTLSTNIMVDVDAIANACIYESNSLPFSGSCSIYFKILKDNVPVYTKLVSGEYHGSFIFKVADLDDPTILSQNYKLVVEVATGNNGNPDNQIFDPNSNSIDIKLKWDVIDNTCVSRINNSYDIPLGGHRIKRIQTFDKPTSTPLVREYEYTDDNGIESGLCKFHLANLTTYGHVVSLSSSNYYPMQFYSGQPVGYASVKEKQISPNEIKQIQYKYIVNANVNSDCYLFNGSFGNYIYPCFDEPANGSLIETKIGNSKTTVNNYSFPNPTINTKYIYGFNVFSRVAPGDILINESHSSGGSAGPAYAYAEYKISSFHKPQISSSITTENFSGKTLSTTFNYIYNTNNHLLLIAENSSASQTGETVEKKYFYPDDLLTEPYMAELKAANRISTPIATEQHKAGILLSKTKTVFAKDATTSNLLASKSIYQAKFPNALVSIANIGNLEKKLNYDRYDSKGNLTQYTPESGIPITYIWGYNQTQPIAKIENATYAEVQQYEANLQTLSNGTDEAALLAALNALRTNLSGAMVTTYTYKPLIGVSTITDPKGDQITYSYDSFNRLQFVKDKSGNILSENQYNYKQ